MCAVDCGCAFARSRMSVCRQYYVVIEYLFKQNKELQNGIQNRSNPFLFIRIFLCGFLYSFIHSFRMGKRNELEKVAYWMETSTMVKIRYFNGGGMATKIKKIQMDEYFHHAFQALWSSMVHDVYYINVNTPEQFFLFLSSLFIVGYILFAVQYITRTYAFESKSSYNRIQFSTLVLLVYTIFTELYYMLHLRGMVLTDRFSIHFIP